MDHGDRGIEPLLRAMNQVSKLRLGGCRFATHKIPVRLAVGSIVGGRTVRNIL